MDRQQKEQFVNKASDIFENASLVIVSHNKGVTVDQVGQLRKDIRDADSSHLVVKNKLVKLAIKGTKYEQLENLFAGPTAITYSDNDPVAAAKALVEFEKETEAIEVIGGAINGQDIGVDGVKELASLPPLENLRAQLLGILQAPATKIAAILQESGSRVARVLNQYSKS